MWRKEEGVDEGMREATEGGEGKRCREHPLQKKGGEGCEAEEGKGREGMAARLRRAGEKWEGRETEESRGGRLGTEG